MNRAARTVRLLRTALVLLPLVFCATLVADLNFQGGSFVNRTSAPLSFDANNTGDADMVMTVGGNVGLGTLSPAANLHIAGNLFVAGNLFLATSARPPSPTAGDIYSDGSALYFYDASAWDDLTNTVFPWSSLSGNTILASGNVGIGTAAPAANLQVTGNVLIGEELNVSSRLLLTDGSVSSPALVFTSDTDTGLFLSSADNLAFGMGGSLALSVGSSALLLSADLQTDRWLGSDGVTALGVNALAGGAFTSTTLTAVGYRALQAITTGYEVVAVGADSLINDTTGYRSTALGANALQSCTTSHDSCAVGHMALASMTTTGNPSVAIGAEAGSGTANMIVAVGYQAMSSGGSAMAAGAGYRAHTSSSGTSVGAMANYAHDDSFSGGDCAGYQANHISGTGRYNAVIGANAKGNNPGGQRNTVVGCDAGHGTGGASDYNTFLGYAAGYSLGDADSNSGFGYRAGHSIGDGDYNLIIGYDQDTPSPATRYHLNIGGILYGNLQDDFIGIGAVSPANNLHVSGNMYISGELTMGGNILPAPGASSELGSLSLAWSSIHVIDDIQVSDVRLKKDIRQLRYGLKEILRLRPVRFHWKGDRSKGPRLGLIAQEVAEVIPEAAGIDTDPARTMGIHYKSLVPVIAGAIGEQQRADEALDSRILKAQETDDLLKQSLSGRKARIRQLLRESVAHLADEEGF
ncbi:MAG: tail fiber domain-containing protein [Planctomycetes bacterium]|nr:tail fiber domain-containing protein [Planctomycetota bacterium]